MGTSTILTIISLLTSINCCCCIIDVYVYESCQQTSLSCTTLESLTLRAPYNLQFSSGTHYLLKPSSVIGGQYFGMKGTDATIVCIGFTNYWLKFFYVQKIEVSGIKFVNCSGIAYISTSDLRITNSVYFGCRSSVCLYIRDSIIDITDAAFANTIVGYNLLIHSSRGTLVNVSMTNTACLFGQFFNNRSTITVRNFNSRNSYGIVLDVRNGSFNLENIEVFHNNYNNPIFSSLCGLLHSTHASVKMYNSFIHYSCIKGTIIASQSNLDIHNSTFLGDSAEFSLNDNSKLLTYGTALKASSSNVTIQCAKFKYFFNLNGGAIDITNNSNLRVSQSFFIQNFAIIGGAIKLDKSTLVALDSTFLENQAHHTGGAIDAYNYATVTLINCSITRNKASHAGGGGVHVLNNGKLQCQDTQFLSNYGFRGGAIAAYQDSTIVTINAVFDGNTGLAGGPIFMEDNCTFYAQSNTTIQHNLGGIMFIARSSVFFLGYQHFHHNKGSFSLSSCSVHIEGIMVISQNWHYMGNFSIEVPTYVTYPYSAMSIHTSVVNVLGHLNISNNAMGGIVCIEGTIEFRGPVTIVNNSAISIQNGFSKGGGIIAYQCILHYHGDVEITDNSATYGGGVYASTTINQFHCSDISLYSNTAQDGGALYLDLNSKLILENQCERHPQLKFNGNRASHNGGAILINDRSYFGVCSRNQDVTSPEYECFIQNTGVVNAFKTISFTNNTAGGSGSNLYGGLLNRCTLTTDPQTTGMTYFKEISSFPDVLDSSVTSEAMQLCICSDLELNCSVTGVTMTVFKGQTIELNMTSVDQASQSVEAKVSAILTTSVSDINGVDPGQLLQQLPQHCSLLKYNVHSAHDTEHLRIYPEGPCLDNGVSTFTIHLNFKPCPNGFQELNGTCKCHQSLTGNDCDIDTQTITRKISAWISYTASSNSSGLVLYSHCPYDYCLSSSQHNVTVNLQVDGGADSQCAFNRSGVLCGRCQRGLSSVLGSSRCLKCSNITLLLLLPMCVLGILVVVAMLTLNLTVEVGVFNEMILFANLVGINYGTFFPPHQPTYHSTLLIDWVNLNLGFETCLYDGLDPYGKVWLEALFPSYLLVLACTLVIMKHRVSTHWTVRLFRERNPKAVLATVLLLVLNKFLILVRKIFSYATLKYPNGTTHTVWLEDASVIYMSSKHIPLAILGILLATYILVFTTVLLTSQNTHIQTILNKSSLKSIIDSYHGTCPSSWCSWPGLLILYRVVAMAMAAFTTPYPKLNLVLFSTATFCVAAMKDMTGISHLHTRCATIGNVYLSSVGFLAIAQLPMKNRTEAIAGVTTVCFITLLSVGVIAWHIYSITRTTAASCWANRTHTSLSTTIQLENQNNPLPEVLVNSHAEVVTTSFLDI